jgi:dienelactone hydrolase
MATVDLEFRSLLGLWREYAAIERSLAFKAGSLTEAQAWQPRLREKLIDLLGGFPAKACDLSPRILEMHEEEGFTRQLVVIQTLPGEFMPVFVLIPHHEADSHLKPVIALHGHGTWGAEAIVGDLSSPEITAFNRSMNYDYAGQLVRRGYLVFAPELRGFGLRLEDPAYQDADDPQWISSCYSVSVNALLLGKTLLGMRIYDVIRLIDYIQTRPETSIETLGCVGLSGGGMLTLFTTALDIRITCAVVSGYFNTFRDSIMAIRHCLCNFVPGLVRVAEMVDIAGLVAPRPLLIESGTQDAIFPVDATRKAYADLQKIYKVFTAIDRLEIDIFEGEHSWSGAIAYDWLACWLNSPGGKNT